MRLESTAIAFCGSAGAALGLNALMGYLTGVPTHVWGPFKPMAIHASAGLILLGVAAAAYPWRDAQRHRHSWSLVVIAMRGAVTSFSCGKPSP